MPGRLVLMELNYLAIGALVPSITFVVLVVEKLALVAVDRVF